MLTIDHGFTQHLFTKPLRTTVNKESSPTVMEIIGILMKVDNCIRAYGTQLVMVHELLIWNRQFSQTEVQAVMQMAENQSG